MKRHNNKNENLYERNGCWYIDFYLPKNLGGKRIRCSLQTPDLERAKYIRNMNINPILGNIASIEVLENIYDKILQLKQSTLSSIENLKYDIQGSHKRLSIQECVDKYLKHLKSSDIRPSTYKNYSSGLKPFVEVLGAKTRIDLITKEGLVKVREHLIEKGIGGNRLHFDFMAFRRIMQWCTDEGLIPAMKENFKIPLPTYRSVHTSLIPKDKANLAMTCKSGWTLPPRIARYTGMRRGEILRITASDITELHGIKCIRIDERSKTHEARIVPIAEKLKPYLKNLSELRKNKKACDYYRLILKKIPGCEKCSFHSWRVYANTNMMEAGVDQAVRMKILGHKSSKSEVHIGYTLN